MQLKLTNVTTLFSRPPAKRLVFYHLPKTAGSSLRSSLGTLYYDPFRPHQRPYFIYSGRVSQRVSRLTGDDLFAVREKFLLMALSTPSYRFIAAHQPFSQIAQEEFGDSTLFMSIFREPVSRFISLYFYNRYKSSDHARIECSLDEYLDSPEGRIAARTYVDWFGRDRGGQVQDLQTRQTKAVANLKTLNIVGVMEDMAGFRARLEEQLQRRVPISTVNRNPRKNRLSEVSKEQLSKIEELCREDLQFYEEAKKICHQ